MLFQIFVLRELPEPSNIKQEEPGNIIKQLLIDVLALTDTLADRLFSALNS